MQILEQTHKYLEQLGTKVFLQKNEHKMKMKMQAMRQDNKQGTGEDGEEDQFKPDEDAEEFQGGELDAFGNKREEDEEEKKGNESEEIE